MESLAKQDRKKRESIMHNQASITLELATATKLNVGSRRGKSARNKETS